MKYLLKIISLALSDYQLAYIMFIIKHKYIPNFKNPRSINEKINYIKLYNRNPLRKVVVDRLKVREYIKTIVPEICLPNVLWHGYHLTEHTWEQLPQKFVIKANHGSKMTRIVNKNIDDFSKIKQITEIWLKKDYSKFGREGIYSDLDKYLIVEEFLTHKNDIPPDFKFFVCKGKVEFIQVDVGRYTKHERNLYTNDFKKIECRLVHPNTNVQLTRPEHLEKAIQLSEIIGQHFDFIRVDLYLIDDKIVFGELTNTPGNGFEKFYPTKYDFVFGSKLPKKIIN